MAKRTHESKHYPLLSKWAVHLNREPQYSVVQIVGVLMVRSLLRGRYVHRPWYRCMNMKTERMLKKWVSSRKLIGRVPDAWKKGQVIDPDMSKAFKAVEKKDGRRTLREHCLSRDCMGKQHKGCGGLCLACVRKGADLPEGSGGIEDAVWHATWLVVRKRLGKDDLSSPPPAGGQDAPTAPTVTPPEQDRPICKVCHAQPDDEGYMHHGRGCYVLDSDGGGDEYFPEWVKNQPAQP